MGPGRQVTEGVAARVCLRRECVHDTLGGIVERELRDVRQVRRARRGTKEHA